MRQILGQAHEPDPIAAPVPIGAPVERDPAGKDDVSGVLRRDYETAFNILQRASQAFPVLMQRCHRLESEVQQTRVQAEADVAAATDVTNQWHQLAAVLKKKLEDSERQNAQFRQRLEAAEKDVAAGRRRVDAAEHQAKLAMGLTTLFHDKIVEAFGVGSPAHTTLDLIVKGAVEPGPSAAS